MAVLRKATAVPASGAFTARRLPNRCMDYSGYTDELRALDVSLFKFGGTEIYLSTLLGVLTVVVVLVWISQFLRTWLLNRILKSTHLDPGTQQAIGAIVHYMVLVVGVMLVLQNFG